MNKNEEYFLVYDQYSITALSFLPCDVISPNLKPTLLFSENKNNLLNNS